MSAKHVIFLGAGASMSSKYPSANELRVRLSGPRQLLDDLVKHSAEEPAGVGFQNTIAGIKGFLSRFNLTFDIFRNGGFGTVDELSKLASQNYPDHVEQMKQLIVVALSSHSPEKTFEESDYYPFVQNLFENDLFTLKKNVTILSYNYDCYLDFLLIRALKHRYYLSGGVQASIEEKNRVSSGFYKFDRYVDLTSENTFRHLKLHGSINYAFESEHEALFEKGFFERIGRFTQYHEPFSPPLIFPWEVFNSKGEFIEKNDFVMVKSSMKFPNKQSQAESLYKLYKTIWQEARKAVQEAAKISFVGMSMHEYLNDGLKFLFNGKHGDVEMTVANTITDYEPYLEKVSFLLRHIEPKMNFKGHWIQRGLVHGGNGIGDGAITPRGSFREFIEKDMN